MCKKGILARLPYRVKLFTEVEVDNKLVVGGRRADNQEGFAHPRGLGGPSRATCPDCPVETTKEAAVS